MTYNWIQGRLATCLASSRSSQNPFAHASGVTKTLALAQTTGGTIWQDLSFSYINVTVEVSCTMKGRVSIPRLTDPESFGRVGLKAVRGASLTLSSWMR